MAHNIVSIKNGDIMNNLHHTIIRKPAIILDTETGCLMGWGEADIVSAKFNKMASAYAGASMPTDYLLYIELSEFHLTREEQCYILKRCIEFTATEFHKQIGREIKADRKSVV